VVVNINVLYPVMLDINQGHLLLLETRSSTTHELKLFPKGTTILKISGRLVTDRSAAEQRSFGGTVPRVGVASVPLPGMYHMN
jgi:hypothetical protein